MSTKRRGSIVTEYDNPLESGNNSNTSSLKLENLTDCKVISNDEANDIIKQLRNISQNDERIALLETLKMPYLFTSEILLKVVDITPSIKTKLSIISIIGPRLTDPKAKMSELTDIFRFIEDKEKVEDILKSRLQQLNSAIYSKVGSPVSKGPTAGRGGRGATVVLGGRGGRGPNRSNTDSMKSVEVNKPIEKTDSTNDSNKSNINALLNKPTTARPTSSSNKDESTSETKQSSNSKPTITPVKQQPTIPLETKPVVNEAKSQLSTSLSPNSENLKLKTQIKNAENLNNNNNNSYTDEVKEEPNNNKRNSTPSNQPANKSSSNGISLANQTNKLPDSQSAVNINTNKPISTPSTKTTTITPSSSTNGKSLDKESIIYNQLGFTKDYLLNLKEIWEIKVEKYKNEIEKEINIVLTSLSLTLPAALQLCNKEIWELKYNREMLYREKENITIEKELKNIWNLLGLTSADANIFNHLLENWEIKVVNNKIDEKNNELLSSSERRRKSDSVDISNEIFHPELIHKSNINKSLEFDYNSNNFISNRRYSNKGSNTNSLISLINESSINHQMIIDKSDDFLSDLPVNRQTMHSIRLLDNQTNDFNDNTFKTHRRKKSLSLDLTGHSNNLFHYLTTNHSTSNLVNINHNSGNESPNSLSNITKSHYNDVKYLIDKNGNNLSMDYVDRTMKTSFALNMDPRDLSDLDYTGPIGKFTRFDPIDRYPIYTYKEILRRNARKQYYELSERELEKYLSNEEFNLKFGMTKENFYKLAKWKQIKLKKSLLLF